MLPTIPDEFSFAHLLGCILGGVEAGRSRSRLRLVLPRGRPEVAERLGCSLRLTAPGRPECDALDGSAGDHRLESSWGRWPSLLPQLADEGLARQAPPAWQGELLAREPEAFLRGLLEVGGRRSVNRFTTRLASGTGARYAYPRLAFSSAHPEVLALCKAACRRLEVDWTEPTGRSLVVTHRHSRARLDDLLGGVEL